MSAEQSEGGDRRTSSWLTVPNVICAARLVASPALVALAAREQRLALVVLFLVLTLSDWIDGKLALLLDQRSEIGPTLDTLADLSMYASLLVAALWIDGERLRAELPWLALAVGSWLATVVYSLIRFRRWPSVHTRSAKMTWGIAAASAVAFLGGWAEWPVRLASVAVVLANLHALAILRVLPVWRADVPSLSAARRLRD